MEGKGIGEEKRLPVLPLCLASILVRYLRSHLSSSLLLCPAPSPSPSPSSCPSSCPSPCPCRPLGREVAQRYCHTALQTHAGWQAEEDEGWQWQQL